VSNSLLQAIIDFVAEQTGASRQKIGAHTTLFGDLGIDGDDAAEFFAEYQQRFNVNLDTLDLNRHFGREGLWPWEIPLLLVNCWHSLRGDDPHVVAKLEPITIQQLAEAAACKMWDEKESHPGETGGRVEISGSRIPEKSCVNGVSMAPQLHSLPSNATFLFPLLHPLTISLLVPLKPTEEAIMRICCCTMRQEGYGQCSKPHQLSASR
jgi:acyl carrier protein